MTRMEKLEAVAAAAREWRHSVLNIEPRTDEECEAYERVDDAFIALDALTAAGYAVVQGWQPIETAPRDRLVEVYAPSPDPKRWTPEVHNLPPVVCLARWHPDAGFCVCEIREVTHWREHVPPAGEATP
jgi:hypothetical protein